MSFVSVVATQRFINVVSDGRVVDLETGEPIQEDYKKFIEVDNRSFVAFAGNAGLSSKVAEVIASNLVNRRREIKNMISELRDSLNRQVRGLAEAQIAIGLINDDNEIELFSFGVSQDITHFRAKDKNDIGYVFLQNSLLDKKFGSNFLENKLREYLAKTGIKRAQDVLNAQLLLNDFVADNDPSVNKVTFKLTIKRYV